ncbi:hypothetical protein QQ977_00980 [Natrialbaceae archaeon AArc-T1-2]|nr:hypothetical protein [Natrialbaceae archaeon AArc-T1-2]WIV67330.1 hypothetical protein QQ977_00980 [Natrialbaceae archaeon AArc-T1-2]
MHLYARITHTGKQVCEVRIYFPVWAETFDIRALNDEDDMGFVPVFMEFFEALEMTTASFSLPVRKFGSSIFDVRTGFDLNLRSVTVWCREPEICSPVIWERGFALTDCVLSECWDGIAAERAFKQIVC